MCASVVSGVTSAVLSSLQQGTSGYLGSKGLCWGQLAFGPANKTAPALVIERGFQLTFSGRNLLQWLPLYLEGPFSGVT